MVGIKYIGFYPANVSITNKLYRYVALRLILHFSMNKQDLYYFDS